MSVIPEIQLHTLAQLIQQKIGLVLEPWQYPFLTKTVLKQMERFHEKHVQSYVQRLREHQDNNEVFEQLVSSITNNETFFFRIPAQYQILVSHIIPELRQHQPNRPLVVWSAGCSTGEEIYTLVLLLQQQNPPLPGTFQFYATDISQEVLNKAQKGVFSRRSVQYVPNAMQTQYFSPLDEQHYQLDRGIIQQVRFGYFNLAKDNPDNLRLPKVDLILFRNVMIYFKKETILHALDVFERQLSDRGTLVLGPAETLWRVSDRWQSKNLGDYAFYMKKPPADLSQPRSPREHRPMFYPSTPVAARTVPVTVPSHPPPAPEAPLKSAETATLGNSELDPLALMGQGRWHEAKALLNEALKTTPDDGSTHHFLALCAEQEGDLEAAKTHFLNALYFDPNLSSSRFLLAKLLEHSGQVAQAMAHCRFLLTHPVTLLPEPGGAGEEIPLHLQKRRLLMEAERLLGRLQE
jgi:chemotaxis protein methyltransferase CheR